MSVLTPFGKAIRKLRIEKGMRMLDFAARVKRSTSFVSAVETGRKPIPDSYVVAASRAMDLTTSEIRELRRTADRTRKEVRLDKLNEEDRELVASFARSLDEVPAEMKAKLKKIVMKSWSGDMPFYRKRRGILVPAMSTQAIRSFADQVRSVFVEDDQIELPIMDILEFRMEQVFEDFYIDVQDKEAMGDDEGRMVAGKNGIILREDVYEGAWNGDGRARFTACHELGHFLIHRNVTMARARDDGDKIFCDSEWQADTFAGTLLMSPRHLPQLKDADDAAKACKMTPAAAKVMWAKYQAEGRFGRLERLPGF